MPTYSLLEIASDDDGRILCKRRGKYIGALTSARSYVKRVLSQLAMPESTLAILDDKGKMVWRK
jgi:hypothetical protein